MIFVPVFEPQRYVFSYILILCRTNRFRISISMFCKVTTNCSGAECVDACISPIGGIENEVDPGKRMPVVNEKRNALAWKVIVPKRLINIIAPMTAKKSVRYLRLFEYTLRSTGVYSSSIIPFNISKADSEVNLLILIRSPEN